MPSELEEASNVQGEHPTRIQNEEEEEEIQEETAGQELNEAELQPIGSAIRSNILSRFTADEEKKVLYSMAAYAYLTKNRNLITMYRALISNNQREASEAMTEETVNFVIAHTKIINIKVQESNATIMDNQAIRTPGIAPSTVVETLATNFHCREEDLEELRTRIQNLTTEGALALGLGSDDEEGHGYISVNLFDF